ncbi:hypothetical protein MIV026R [Invertebrate iridescent virus 3]|uniref:Uncharacterized protein 026R n=1 Tax=Invertebrate iridescent virus 3 TaxID=345201 RepID=VF350_IIV3|nr:hypothetical protein MIV026R [Invertebrate iridescent virus 3]Q197D4.1 RecName: Full=Uncharacterized protein 026R [Invertebrate iridescent virus 3]ABF82056.1 hypothetical protein MIV026R [Invertebrate iridescent virus 3]
MSNGKIYQKIDLSNVDRKKIKDDHESVVVHNEIKHTKELWTFPRRSDWGTSGVRCYWDHHEFDGTPIYCPVSYRPRQVAKISKNEIKPTCRNQSIVDVSTFTIKENIPKSKDVSNLLEKDLIKITDPYYEVDGVFCSPECCVAWIRNEKTKAGGSMYSDSERLLHSMLGLVQKITPANNFRLLKSYGGNLTIDQFRKNNKCIKYEYYGTTVLISHLFEKKINLSSD